MRAIFKRELRALFGSLTGWGSLALLLAVAGVSVFIINVRGASPVFADNILYLALGMALSCGLLCANAFPAERRQRTERALYALPVRSGGVFFGKLLPRLVVVLMGGALLALYPVVMSLLVPSVSMGEGLGGVLAVCALGVLFAATAVCCSAFSRTAVGAFIAYAALVALSFALPYAAPRVAALTSLPPLALVLMPALAGVLAWAAFNDVLIGFAAAALVEAPLLLHHLRGTDSAVTGFLARAMKAAAVFDPLSLFARGILDVPALVRWLSMALPFAVAGILAVAARREGRRRAL